VLKWSRVVDLKILVAEDDVEYRNVLRQMFEHCGHDVVTAEDGTEALDMLKHTPVELIVSDVHMPRCSGSQLHEIIRRDDRFRTLPFIYLTGYTILRLATPLDETGLDFMMNKVLLKDLMDLVNNLSTGVREGGHRGLALGAA
jgi:CheY-like chemotaxis protein